MTSDTIAARNRANAQKSTGPRTERGKSVVSGNARRHGATSRPDPNSVATFLAIILDRPRIGPHDLLPDDEIALCALALAEAEVRLVAAERALNDLETGHAQRMVKRVTDPKASKEVIEDLMRMREFIKEVLETEPTTKKDRRKAESLLLRTRNHLTPRVIYHSQYSQHRLLKRYVADALSKRRSALLAFLAITKGHVEGRTAT